jgi:hypothetical protein
VAEARSRWLAASESASHLATKLFQPGSGYGDPDARRADEHRLQTAKDEAERLFREYYDIDKRHIESEMLKLHALNNWPRGPPFLSQLLLLSRLSSTSL